MTLPKYITAILVFLLISINANSQNYPAKPNPFRLVVDNGNVLSNSEQNSLENKLQTFYRNSSTQIVILTIETSDGEPLSMYATEIGERWGVGQKGQDNGIVIVAAMKDRDVYISTGYGVEEYIPDAIAKRIVESYIIPNFKSGNYSKGFNEATDKIIGLLEGKFTADDIKGRDTSKKKPPISFLIFIIIFIVLVIINTFRKGGRGGFGRGAMTGAILFGSGGFSSGGGGFGGGGGSFGGGSFGGGGAGGSW